MPTVSTSRASGRSDGPFLLARDSEKTNRDISLGAVVLGSRDGGATGGITGTVGSGYRDIIGAWVGSDFLFITGKPRATLRAGGRLGSYPTMGVLGIAIAALAIGGGVQSD